MDEMMMEEEITLQTIVLTGREREQKQCCSRRMLGITLLKK